jgi:hypothetical protein
MHSKASECTVTGIANTKEGVYMKDFHITTTITVIGGGGEYNHKLHVFIISRLYT